MSKISDSVSDQLENAAQEALEHMGVDPFTQLMNAGIEYEQDKEEKADKPKRKRRTKAEMEAARQEDTPKVDDSILTTDKSSHIIAIVDWDQDKDDDNKLPTKVQIPDDILVGDYDMETVSDYLTNTVGYCHKGFEILFPSHHDSHEQFCQWEIEKAHLNGRPEPDFDYRNFYEKGSTVWFVRYHEKYKTKEIMKLYLRTIYPRMMVGCLDKGYCECIGIQEKDNIFFNQRDAMDFFNSLQGNPEDSYDENTGKKKRKRKSKDEDDEDVDDVNVYDEENDEEEDYE